MCDDIILPMSFDRVVFCIIVIAGDVNEEDSRVFSVIALMDSQKLPRMRQHSAVSGKAIKLLAMQTHDLARRFLDSNLSEMIPPANEEIKPPIASDSALTTANYCL